jgi:hypothetical protein
MWDARNAVRFTWIGGVLNRVIRYICGNLQLTPNTGDPQIDQMYKDYFWNWAGNERSEEEGTIRCDITGRASFLKQIQMAMFGFFTDGDYGFVEVDPLFSPTGEFCLQGIQADRIGSPLEATTFEDYIGGVSIDIYSGRIKSYRIFRRTRTNQYVDKTEVPVNSFIHLIDPEFSDEYRSYTKLLRMLNDLRDIREWVEFEKLAGKTQAQFAALVGLKDPFSNQGPFAWSGVTKGGTPYQDAEYGKIMRMAEGETFSMVTPSSRPSGSFQQFIDTVIRMMSISFGISYGLMWDIATLGGATARIEVEADHRAIAYWQKMLEDIIVKRTYQKVISQGVGKEEIPPTQNWRSCIIGWGKFLVADLGYETQIDIDATTHGIIKVDDVAQKYGYNDAREVFQANARAFNNAIDVGAEEGAPVETFAAGLYPNGTNQKAAYLTPAPIPPPPAGSIEAISDKGVGKMIEIMEKVGEGVIDREAAIQAMMTMFHIPRGKAEKLIPEAPEEPIAVTVAERTPAKVTSSGGKNGSKGGRRK